MKITAIKSGQKFTTFFNSEIFQLLKIDKKIITFVNINTSELHTTTPNDVTEFFMVK